MGTSSAVAALLGGGPEAGEDLLQTALERVLRHCPRSQGLLAQQVSQTAGSRYSITDDLRPPASFATRTTLVSLRLFGRVGLSRFMPEPPFTTSKCSCDDAAGGGRGS